MIKQTMIGVALAAGMAATASGQIAMQEIQRIDLTPLLDVNSQTFIGNKASAVAWNGSDLYIGSFNAGGGGGNGSGIASFSGGAFSVMQFISDTPFDRGFSGLAIKGNRLAAAYDSGASHPQGIQVFDTSTGSPLWAKAARGGSGVAFDPGFNGDGAGVAWTTFGSGRRALQDTETGADIYTTANGMIITPDFGSSFWRAMDFASNGDMVARRANDLTFLSRTGENSGSASILVDNGANAPFVNGQNLAYVENSPFGDFVIWNDRATTNTGQSAENVLRATALDGSSLALSLSLLGGDSLALGNGYYDFSWDQATNTLAVLDYFNNNVHIFLVPAPGAAGLLGMAGLLAARRRR
ncbi:MAG: hypothetical protein LAT64_06110 [Phycisphaerales bacterium]|nr:hypothetical protein [Planctomycetota bacterium]MCH8508329.1 hypothetical protein [Phycisphaerales bacterium]